MTATELPDFMTVEEAAKLLRIGRTAAYQLARMWRDSKGASGPARTLQGHRRPRAFPLDRRGHGAPVDPTGPGIWSLRPVWLRSKPAGRPKSDRRRVFRCRRFRTRGSQTGSEGRYGLERPA